MTHCPKRPSGTAGTKPGGPIPSASSSRRCATRSVGPTTSARGAEWATWSHAELQRLLGNARVRAQLPPVEQKAFDRVEAALDRLAGLDSIEGPVDRAQFRAGLVAELDGALLRRGRIGDGVMVGPLSTSIGIDASEVVVVGAADGVLPRPPRSDPLLHDHDRELALPGIRLSRDSTDEQRRHFLAALAAAPSVTITRPRGDLRRSSVRPASRWIEELVGAARQETEIASFIDGVVRANHSVSALDDRTRLLLSHVRDGGRIDRSSLVAADRALRSSLTSVRARERAELTAYDGDLAGLPVPSPFSTDRAIGITRLESWLGCPHAYFMEQVLRVAPIDDPEVLLQISAMERGSLVHRVLDRFLRQVLDGALSVPTPTIPWSDEHHALARAILEEEMAAVEAAGLAGRSLLWEPERRRLRDDIAAVLTNDDLRRAASGLVPLSSEQPFDGRAAAEAEAATESGRVAGRRSGSSCRGGRAITFRGQVDRVDVAADGRIAIVDYKSGRSSYY